MLTDVKPHGFLSKLITAALDPSKPFISFSANNCLKIHDKDMLCAALSKDPHSLPFQSVQRQLNYYGFIKRRGGTDEYYHQDLDANDLSNLGKLKKRIARQEVLNDERSQDWSRSVARRQFLKVIIAMASDPSVHSVRFGERHDSIIIEDGEALRREMSRDPRRPAQFNSIVKQLNNYGFKKRRGDALEFCHEQFDNRDLRSVRNIKRKMVHSLGHDSRTDRASSLHNPMHDFQPHVQPAQPSSNADEEDDYDDDIANAHRRNSMLGDDDDDNDIDIDDDDDSHLLDALDRLHSPHLGQDSPELHSLDDDFSQSETFAMDLSPHASSKRPRFISDDSARAPSTSTQFLRPQIEEELSQSNPFSSFPIQDSDDEQQRQHSVLSPMKQATP